MTNLVKFPGVYEIFEAAEPEPDPGTIINLQSDLLARWKAFGEELRRRAEYPLPIGLEIELHDLLDMPDA